MLRAATRGAHDRVDALFSGFDLSRTADYRHFMAAQAAAFLPAEAALDDAGAGRLFRGWSEARRAHLPAADLAELGIAHNPLDAPPTFASPAAVAGAAYVLEGSRLGGALLARRLAPGLPRRFLSAGLPAGGWRTFLARLEQLVRTDVERREAVASAEGMFNLFANAAAAPVPLPLP
jgi:heme oxygenase